MKLEWYEPRSQRRVVLGHSLKWCCCGGHNHSNPKKNLKNHSTLSKYQYRMERRFILKIKGRIA